MTDGPLEPTTLALAERRADILLAAMADWSRPDAVTACLVAAARAAGPVSQAHREVLAATLADLLEHYAGAA